MLKAGKSISPIFYLLAALIFVLSIIWGYLQGIRDPEGTRQLVERTFSMLSFVQNLPHFLLFALIFLNNSIKALFVILLGFFFGLFPLYFLLTNGKIIGLIVVFSASQIGVAAMLAGLLPHGIIELFALILASGYGLWLGVQFPQTLARREKFAPFLKLALQKYLRIVLPLLFLAALIEAFITPLFLAHYLP